MKKLLLVLGFISVVFSIWAGEFADSELEKCVKNQDMKWLKIWLDNDYANKNYVISSRDKTVLMLACEGQWAEGVKYLLEQGANVNYSNRSKQTALMFCARKSKNADIMEMLCEEGANLENADKEGKTPLMYACEGGSVAVVQFLLDHGANMSAKTVHGDTPLMFAVRAGQTDVVRKILPKAGSGATSSNEEGDNILSLAIDAPGDPVVMLRVIKEANKGISPTLRKHGMPVLFWALKENKSPKVRLFLMDWYSIDELLAEQDEEGHNFTYYANVYNRRDAKEKLQKIAKTTGQIQEQE